MKDLFQRRPRPFLFHQGGPGGIRWCHARRRRAAPTPLEELAGAIRCPTLAIDTENERSFVGRARPLYDALTCEKTWMYFTDAEGAGEHCEVGAALRRNQRISDCDQSLFTRERPSDLAAVS